MLEGFETMFVELNLALEYHQPMIVSRRLTYADLELLPEDGICREIHGGELVVLASPNKEHQDILGNLNDLVRPFVRQHKSGYVAFAPFVVVFEPDRTAIPDYLFVVAERLDLVKGSAVFGAPDWIVEVLSPSSGKRDLREKPKIYQRYGVQLYWVIDSVREEVLVWFEDWTQPSIFQLEDQISIPCIAGLSFKVSALFEPFLGNN